ncbi:MAG: hypothetical protein BZ138_02200 [Methanosphaera sp. rholeuAM270]|nr:MAG: hypothetical protein BZ138_02200 [Methanosphaera sp. rholeuAM270]
MAVLFVLTLIPLVLSILNLVNNTYLFVGLFAIDFLIVGIAATKVMHPLLDTREVLRKITNILPFGLLFSLISGAIVYHFNMVLSSILLFLSLISIVLIMISAIRTTSNINKIENPREFAEKHLKRIIILLAIFCIVSYVGMEVPPFSVIPLWFGLCIPFIMLLPGYLVLNIVNPYKDAIRVVERIGISIFSSLVITSIVGLIVVQIEHLLNMRHVTLVLVAITLVILLPLYYIRIKEKNTQELFNDERLNRIFLLITVVAICAVFASAALVTSGFWNGDESTSALFQGNTTFEVSGIHNVPDENSYYTFTNGEELNLSVNIGNKEHRDMEYTLKIELNNETTNKTLDEQKVKVKDNGHKTINTNITMTTGKKDIKFTLYDNNNQPYKIRHLYVNVIDESE